MLAASGQSITSRAQQIRLSSLLVDMAALAVFLAVVRQQITTFRRLEAGSGYPIASLAGIGIGWCMLLALYYRRGLRRAILFHVLTPIINTVIGLGISAPTNSAPWYDLIGLITSGCWLAVLVSFPVAVLERVGRTIDSDRTPRVYLAYCVVLGMIAATIVTLPIYLLFWRLDHTLLYGALLGALVGARRALGHPDVARCLGLPTMDLRRPLLGAVLGTGLGPFAVAVMNRNFALSVHALFGAPIPPPIGMLLGIPLALLGLLASLCARRWQVSPHDERPATTGGN